MADNRNSDGWTGLERVDGLRAVYDYVGNHWTIVTHDDGAKLLSTCPCCNLPFRELRNAKLVADALYPRHGD